jgi:GDP/UDP-N,N'-diacetylbacillosamine 2-epimerase (hydrolysing)
VCHETLEELPGKGERMRVDILQETRADAGISQPLVDAMQKDLRFDMRVIHDWEDVRGSIGWLIVLGDRRAMLDATIEAAYENVPVAHIQGGDRTGTIDDPARHAITRFAHLHFPCTQESADRLIRMGEEPWRIKVVGPLGIYAMPGATLLDKAAICAKLKLDASREIVLVIQHPVSTQQDQAGAQMGATREACDDYQTVVIYPNHDPGYKAIEAVIEGPFWVDMHAFRNLPYLDFLSLLKASSVIVGNSSTGLYEAPLYGVPAVNIGTRQQDREHGGNVLNCINDKHLIRDAIVQALWEGHSDCPSHFKSEVDGVSIIMNTLAVTPVNERLLQKRLMW